MVRAKLRKKYSGPTHLWQMDRIKKEKLLLRKYGCKSKTEIWKINSKLRNFRAQARRLITLTGKQAQLEKQQLLNKLFRLGLVEENAKIEDVLALDIEDLMDRRLQTLIQKKKMANSIKQARQMITHGHVRIGNKKVKSPSHLVDVEQEPQITFSNNSPFASEMHPEIVAGREKREKKEKGRMVEEKALELKKGKKPKVEKKSEKKLEKKEDSKTKTKPEAKPKASSAESKTKAKPEPKKEEKPEPKKEETAKPKKEEASESTKKETSESTKKETSESTKKETSESTKKETPKPKEGEE